MGSLKNIAIALVLMLALPGCSTRQVQDPDDGGPGDGDKSELGADRGTPGDQGGPGTGLFGDRCGTKVACTAGLLCVSMGGSHGFCSTSCPKPGKTCKSGPPGTVPVCLLKGSGGTFFCAFLCKTATAGWPCPKELTCSSQPNPPGSKQYVCIP